ncbi:MAG: hypothetical protein WBL50_20865 [Candidatus Acidiferrum sp.]
MSTDVTSAVTSIFSLTVPGFIGIITRVVSVTRTSISLALASANPDLLTTTK